MSCPILGSRLRQAPHISCLVGPMMPPAAVEAVAEWTFIAVSLFLMPWQFALAVGEWVIEIAHFIVEALHLVVIAALLSLWRATGAKSV